MLDLKKIQIMKLKPCLFGLIFFLCFPTLTQHQGYSLHAETLKTYDINFYNVAVKGIEPQELNLKWKFFLLDNDQILFNKPTDKHRNDQFCSYTFEIDETGKVIESSIKLVEHRKNYAYNLKAFEFLKDFDFELKTVKPEKIKKHKSTGVLPRADFVYLAY